jgi:site-specific recombinase XerD
VNSPGPSAAIVLATPATTTGLELRERAVAWPEVVLRFLAEQTSRRTKENYAAGLADLSRWAADRGLDPLELSRAHLAVWRDDLAGRPYAPGTVALRLSAAASCYRYAVEEGYLERSPAASVKRPKVPDASPRSGLSREEAAAVLEVARPSPQDATVAGLLLLLGLRASELEKLSAADLALDRGHRTVKVRGKGDRLDRVPVAPYLADALDRLLAEPRPPTAPILANARGGPLDRHAVTTIVRRLAAAAGIERRVCPHDLRHAMVTHALAAGVPLHAVQDAARHADPRTTRRYDRAARQLDGHATYTLAAYLGTAA